MSKSPLAGAFAAGSTPEKKKNKKGAALLLIAGIGMTASLGGVFAANSITINSGNAIQFGQGVALTNSCESAITAEMTQAFVNATNDFKVDAVKLSDVSYNSCAGKTIRVSFLDTNGAVVCSVDGTHKDSTSPIAGTAPNFTVANDKDSFVVPAASGSADYTITLKPAVTTACDASTVKKIAVTTS